MKRERLLVIAVVGLLLLNLSVLVFLFLDKKGGHPHPGRPGFPPPPHERPEGPKRIIIERLHFDEKQIALYEQSIKKHAGAIDSLQGLMDEAKQSLYASLGNDSTEAYEKPVERISEIQREIEKVNYFHFKEIKSICTAEQQEAFRELSKELSQLFRRPGPPPAHPKP